ncbi:PSP1-domain-containing protein [Gonapodya prolifera JEL478]|uniref:PSP1-domain-containing protein n=1 Tax=Gonapodya prolifera (strain JEL478) TaxID=1344416 RepID=A0A139A3M6_GONPJ|nr:PSP1-domain-containing protein [Gonapodya prolifera JEL478]|eukprot:KXS11381.1 PSP1-domain-containing protein [Gonapodya prolifera JEL478]
MESIVGGNGGVNTPGVNTSPTGIESFIQNEINDYFENTENRARAWAEGARNLQYHQYSPRWPLFVVEFKAGRKDFFYFSPDAPSPPIRRGDFVIVEADRGRDLGKVVEENITNASQVQSYQSQYPDSFVDQSPRGEVQPKRIFRQAQTAELAMLATKMHDEELALIMCQQKARQRRLPMEVVDAEFQWDRKKLTFYFVAERRIDFRELVRELFKVYKTRIWLCACGGDQDVSLPAVASVAGSSFTPSSPGRAGGQENYRMAMGPPFLPQGPSGNGMSGYTQKSSHPLGGLVGGPNVGLGQTNTASGFSNSMGGFGSGPGGIGDSFQGAMPYIPSDGYRMRMGELRR